MRDCPPVLNIFPHFFNGKFIVLDSEKFIMILSEKFITKKMLSTVGV